MATRTQVWAGVPGLTPGPPGIEVPVLCGDLWDAYSFLPMLVIALEGTSSFPIFFI